MPLDGVIERVKTLDKPPNEEATKLQVVLPILRELGWDAYEPSRVQPEFAVGAGRVDLALLAPDRVVALIEVKAAGVRLEEHVEQTLRYAFHEGADICVLTTGLLWWLYLPREKGQPDERRFAELDLLAESVDELVTDFSTYLGYEDLVGHRAEGHAKAALQARLNARRLDSEMPRVWASMLADPPQALIELVQSRVSVEVSLRPSNEQVSGFLSRQASGARATQPGGSLAEPSYEVRRAQPPRSASLQPRAVGRRPKTSVTGFRLWGATYPVSKWPDALQRVAQALYERDPSRFATVVGSPDGRRSYVEADERNLSPSARASARRVGPFWVECNASAETIQERCKRLIELCGYSRTDIEFMTN